MFENSFKCFVNIQTGKDDSDNEEKLEENFVDDEMEEDMESSDEEFKAGLFGFNMYPTSVEIKVVRL